MVKKKKKSESLKVSEPCSPEAMGLLEVSLLKERFNALQNENEAIKKENHLLKQQIGKDKEDEDDVFYYLHKKLDDNFDVINSLESQISEKNSLHEESTSAFKAEIGVVKDANKEQVDKLLLQLRKAEASLEKVNAFRERKDALERELQELNGSLEAERIKHQEETLEIERKNVQEKERLKKEMLIKIKETKQNLLSMTEDQLHTTTKRTIMENEQLIIELQYQSKEAEKLVSKNLGLVKDNADLRRQLRLKNDSESEYSKRNFGYQKLVKKLQEKVKTLEEANELSGLTMKPSATAEAPEALQIELSEMREIAKERADELSEYKGKMKTLQLEHKRMVASQDECYRFLLSCLEDVERQSSIGKPKKGNAVERRRERTYFSEFSPTDKQIAISTLIKKLNSSSIQGEKCEQPLKSKSREKLERKLNIELPCISPQKPSAPNAQADAVSRSIGIQTNPRGIDAARGIYSLKGGDKRASPVKGTKPPVALDRSPTKSKWDLANANFKIWENKSPHYAK